MEHAGLKLFIDESLPPDFALWLNDTGNYDAIHPLHVGRCGEHDHKVLARCLEEARTIVTQNARDFRKLVEKRVGHPGVIILPSVDKATTWALLQAALAFLEAKGAATQAIIGHVLEALQPERMILDPLPVPQSQDHAGKD